MSQLIPIIFLGLIVWLWWEGARAREAATAAAIQACKQCNVQFLDQTVAIRGMKLGRDARGRLCVLRKYRFEFTESGAARSKGFAIMRGQQLADMHLELTVDVEAPRDH